MYKRQQYNGKNILDGSAGAVSFQVGANVGQTVSLNLAQSVSSASLGGGAVQAGNTIGSLAVSLDSNGNVWNSSTSTGSEITQLNLVSDGKGSFTVNDQNGQAVSFSTSGLFDTTTTPGQIQIKSGSNIDPATVASKIDAQNSAAYGATTPIASGTTLGTVSGFSLNATTGADDSAAPQSTDITSITVKSDGNYGYTFWDQSGNQLNPTGSVVSSEFASYAPAVSGTSAASLGAPTAGNTKFSVASSAKTQTVNQIDVSTQSGATNAIESIDDALTTVNNIQATLGAAQNRFTGISTTQQAQSTDLSNAQSQIQDANFAQETANLSKAQVLQQAGISVLAQANSLPQQVLKLLQ